MGIGSGLIKPWSKTQWHGTQIGTPILSVVIADVISNLTLPAFLSWVSLFPSQKKTAQPPENINQYPIRGWIPVLKISYFLK